MATVPFDTLQASKPLRNKGFPLNQAEALAELRRNALKDFNSDNELATKKGLAEIEARIVKDMRSARFGFSADVAAPLAVAITWPRWRRIHG